MPLINLVPVLCSFLLLGVPLSATADDSEKTRDIYGPCTG